MLRGHGSHVVGDVSAGDVAAGEVGFFRWVFVDEFEDIDAVFVREGESIFRGEAVVDGDDDGGELSGEAAAEVVVGLGAGGKENEAAVEINDDRKILVFPGSGTEVAKPEVPGRVEGGVGSDNAVDWFVGGGNFEVDKLHERAVDGAIPAKACVRDGVEGGKQEPDLPWC